MKTRRPKMYSMIEYPGLTVSEQIELMKKLNIWSPDVENILKWHPVNCPICDKKYFPSGSNEQRCWVCSNTRDKHLTKLRVRKFRRKHDM